MVCKGQSFDFCEEWSRNFGRFDFGMDDVVPKDINIMVNLRVVIGDNSWHLSYDFQTSKLTLDLSRHESHHFDYKYDMCFLFKDYDRNYFRAFYKVIQNNYAVML